MVTVRAQLAISWLFLMLVACSCSVTGCGTSGPSYKDRLDKVDPATYPLDEPGKPTRQR